MITLRDFLLQSIQWLRYFVNKIDKRAPRYEQKHNHPLHKPLLRHLFAVSHIYFAACQLCAFFVVVYLYSIYILHYFMHLWFKNKIRWTSYQLKYCFRKTMALILLRSLNLVYGEVIKLRCAFICSAALAVARFLGNVSGEMQKGVWFCQICHDSLRSTVHSFM